MAKKHALLLLSIALLIVVVINFSLAGANNSIVFTSQEKGVVEKTRGDDFKVTITFQNIGKAEGNWSVNVVFEGESWVWKGTPKNLTLDENDKKTLVWNGVVPANAAFYSIARLVVYYDNSFKALDWWIRVVPLSELIIKTSYVS